MMRGREGCKAALDEYTSGQRIPLAPHPPDSTGLSAVRTAAPALDRRLTRYCQIDPKTIPRRRIASLLHPLLKPGLGEMRRILLSTLKILISAALLYFALRKADLAALYARIDGSSLGWIGIAIAVTFLQIFIGVLRWREISAECGAPLPTRQAMRFNVIGTFFNQTLPSSIGGDAVRLWLVARSGHGWRAATYSIFVDRAIGLIALAIIVVASLPCGSVIRL
jgi:uncharacterized membrane protein YbhN (UPF0104 family)